MKTIIKHTIILLLIFISISISAKDTDKTLVITNSSAYPPFSFIDEDGKPNGLLVDLWKEWAKQNNQKIEFKLVDWDETLLLIKNKKADIHAGLFYSDSRNKYMDFSKALLPLTTRLFISNELTEKKIEDIKSYKIGTVKGGFEEEFLRKNYSGYKLKLFKNNEELIESAIKGEIKVFVADYPVAMYLLHRLKAPEKFRILKTMYKFNFQGSVSKGNTELVKKINEGFKRISETDKERIIQKWLQSDTHLPKWVLRTIVLGTTVIILIILIVFIFILYKNKKDLIKKVKERTKSLSDKNKELEDALIKLKRLNGLLPICASCKKIRDDKGYWNQIETYISEHSEAEFSHSICPSCTEKLYPKLKKQEKA